jgi:hypothetical protein
MKLIDQDLRILRWHEARELFVGSEPILVFVTDTLDDYWWTVPGDVIAMLETMRSTAARDVRTFAVDFRVDPDFLPVFGARPGPTVARRLPGARYFETLPDGFRYSDLIEFCRDAYAQDPARDAAA